jgi:hypothetical protein
MSLSGSPVSLAPAPRPAGGGRPVSQLSPSIRALRSRVELYGLALATDQTPNAYGLTPEDRAGGMLDRMPVVDALRATQVLSAVGVSL